MTGTTGPEQPFGGISTVGGSTHTLTATAQVLCFDTLQASNGVVPSITPCRLTIIIPGVYEINYKWLVTTSVATALSFFVRNNNTNIVTETYTMQANIQRIVYGSFFVALGAGDMLDVTASSAPNATATSPVGLASIFSAKRIGALPPTGGVVGRLNDRQLSCNG